MRFTPRVNAMSWEFNCEFCSARLRVPENTAGRRVRCPACSADQVIPDLGATASLPPAKPSAPQFVPGVPPVPPALEEPDYSLRQPEDPLASPYQAPRAPPVRTPGRAAASERVRAPAIAMIVLASVCLALLGPALLFFLVAAAVEPDEAAETTVNFILCLINVGPAVLMLLGGINMLKRRNRGLAIAGAIAGMIPMISPCCLLGLPLGIWSLSVLNDPAVRRAFR